MKVKDFMYTQLYFIPPTATVRDAAKMMAEKTVGSLLVKKNEEIIGIITQGDIVERVIAKGKNPEETKIGEIKNYPLVMIDEETDVMEAANLLSKYKIRRLMVMRQGTIIGIISTKVIGAHLNRLIKKYNI